MGRPRSDEPRNWGLTVKLQKSVGKRLEAISSKLGLSKASVISQLILRFGELLIKESQSKIEGSGELDTAGISDPVSPSESELGGISENRNKPRNTDS